MVTQERPGRGALAALALLLALVGAGCAHRPPPPPPATLEAAVGRLVEAWRREDRDALVELTAPDRRELSAAYAPWVLRALETWTVRSATIGPCCLLGEGTWIVWLDLAPRDGEGVGRRERVVLARRGGAFWLLDL